MLAYRRLQNVCNRKVKSEKATAFLIWMILLFSVVRLTTISEPRFCFSVAYILQSPVMVVVGTVECVLAIFMPHKRLEILDI